MFCRGAPCRGCGRVYGRGQAPSPSSSAAQNRPAQSADDRSPISNGANIRQPEAHAWFQDAAVTSCPGIHIRGRRHDRAAPIALSELPASGVRAAVQGFRGCELPDRPKQSTPTVGRPRPYDVRHSSRLSLSPNQVHRFLVRLPHSSALLPWSQQNDRLSYGKARGDQTYSSNRRRIASFLIRSQRIRGSGQPSDPHQTQKVWLGIPAERRYDRPRFQPSEGSQRCAPMTTESPAVAPSGMVIAAIVDPSQGRA
jgi:hypothetical protein